MKNNAVSARMMMLNWVAWIAATTIGYALGMALSSLIVGATARQLSPLLGGMIYIVWYGALIGIFLGLVQFVAIPRSAVSLRDWLTATALGTAFGFTAAAVVAEILGNLLGPSVSAILAEATIESAAGALVGLTVGFAQWRTLQGMLPNRSAWLIASGLGGALGYSITLAVLELFEFQLLKANTPLSYGAILGMFIGAAQGLVLRLRYRT